MATTVIPPPARSASPDEHRRRGLDGGRVLVLNATFEPINVCTVRRAIVLLLKARAEMLEQGCGDAAFRALAVRAPDRDPPDLLRPGSTRRAPAQDHTPRGIRARRLDMPVLRRALQPDRRPRDPPLEGRRRRAGRTSSPRARRATVARATARRRRRTCTRNARRASRGRRSSSTCRARRSRRLGARTCRRSPSVLSR